MMILIIQLSQNQLKQKLILSILVRINFDKAVRQLILIMLKMSGYVKRFKTKEEDKDKSNKLMSFRIDNEKLLGKYKAIWTKI